MTNIANTLLDRQRNIIIGTVLGGSSLVLVKGAKHHFLSMRDKKYDWIQYKAEELGSYFKQVCQYGSTYRAFSKCAPELSVIYNQYYRDGKRYVSDENLSPLKDIGLAVWFLDGGSMTGRGNRNAYLSTTRFGKEGSEIVRSYFQSLDISCNVQESKARLRVLFTVEGTERLLKVIAPCFPPCVS